MNMLSQTGINISLALALHLAFCAVANAQQDTTFLPNSGTLSWLNSSYWSNGIPTSGHRAIIDESATALVHTWVPAIGQLLIENNGGVAITGGNTLHVLGDCDVFDTASRIYLGDSTTSGVLQVDGQLFNGGQIEGAGVVSANSGFINTGQVVASRNGQRLTLSGSMENHGELLAINGGELRLSNGTFLNHSGGTVGTSGGRVSLNGATVIGGEISGTIELVTASTFRNLDNLEGFIFLNSQLDIYSDQDRQFDVTISDTFGVGRFVKSGNGVIEITSPGRHHGRVSVVDGTLKLGSLFTFANAESFAVVGPGILDVNRRVGIRTVSQAFSGDGTVLQSGAGAVDFTNQTSQFSGAVNVSGGTISLLDFALDQSSSFGVSSGATLEFNRTGNSRIEDALISGAGTISKVGLGTVEFDNSGSPFSGQVLVYEGRATFSDGALEQVSSFDAGSPGTIGFDLSNGYTRVEDGIFKGHGTIQKMGAGSLLLTRENTGFAGSFVVDQGLLEITNNWGAAIVSVDNGELRLSGAATLTSSGDNVSSYVGLTAGSNGAVTVDGPNTEWGNTETVYVGNLGSGVLTVQSGGMASAKDGVLGRNTNATGTAIVNGDGSQWNNSRNLYVGISGDGTLTVAGGGTVNNVNGYIAHNAGSTGTATVTGNNSHWNNSGHLFIGGSGSGAGGTGSLTVVDQGHVAVGGTTKLWNTGTLTLAGGSLTTGAFDNSQNGTFTFNNGTLTVSGGSFDPGSPGYSIDGGTAGETPELVLSEGASGNFTSSVVVGDDNQGRLQISGGSQLSNFRGYLGIGVDSSGSATVSGIGSQWNHADLLSVGYGGIGSLTVEAGGVVDNTVGYIGHLASSSGYATVSDSGSQWNSSNLLFLGNSGTGMLDVESGGVVNSLGGVIGRNVDSTGTATITGNGSQWNNSSGFYVGLSGEGSLRVENGGAVNNGDGFIAHNSGSIGTASVVGDGSNWNNQGDLFIGGSGSGAGGNGLLVIRDNGLVTVSGTTQLWSGGTLELDNASLATGALINEGSIRASGGTSTIDGSVMNAGAIHVDPGSNLVFLDDFVGSGQFTGLGMATFQGGLLPGSSPGVLEFASDVTLDSTSTFFVELGGLDITDFDQLILSSPDADLSIYQGAQLDVQLINGFTMDLGMEFIIADIAGNNAVFGGFEGLGEGDRIGTYDGVNLFISYAAGSGNDIALFTAVPEPSGLLYLVAVTCGLLSFHRRRQLI